MYTNVPIYTIPRKLIQYKFKTTCPFEIWTKICVILSCWEWVLPLSSRYVNCDYILYWTSKYKAVCPFMCGNFCVNILFVWRTESRSKQKSKKTKVRNFVIAIEVSQDSQEVKLIGTLLYFFLRLKENRNKKRKHPTNRNRNNLFQPLIVVFFNF